MGTVCLVHWFLIFRQFQGLKVYLEASLYGAVYTHKGIVLSQDCLALAYLPSYLQWPTPALLEKTSSSAGKHHNLENLSRWKCVLLFLQGNISHAALHRSPNASMHPYVHSSYNRKSRSDLCYLFPFPHTSSSQLCWQVMRQWPVFLFLLYLTRTSPQEGQRTVPEVRARGWGHWEEGRGFLGCALQHSKCPVMCRGRRWHLSSGSPAPAESYGVGETLTAHSQVHMETR